MSHLQLYRDDLLNRFPGNTFTETTVGSMTKVEFFDSGSALVFEATKLVADDAYQNIHHNLVGTFAEALPRLTTTQRDALTDPSDGLQFFETTSDEVQVYYDGEFETVGAGEWKVRPAQVVTTTDATQTTVDSFTIDDEETYLIQVSIVATESGGGNRGGAIKSALVYRTGGGSATIQGAVETNIARGSDGAWLLDITVSGNDVRASVTGVAATTITWKCSMQFIEQ